MNYGSRWFRRFYRFCKKLDPHLRFKRIRLGYYRIYWKDKYLYEVYKEMPEHGYDWDELDPRLEDQKYYEEYEDNTELTRKIKNFVEGYWEAVDRIRTRVYMVKNDKEFNENAGKAYQQMRVR
jgi:hypothetical protein